MGNAYSFGEGVTQNNEEAKKWYQMAAAQNSTSAMFKLNPSLSILKSALLPSSYSARQLSYLLQYGLLEYSYVFLKQNNKVELATKCSLTMSKTELGQGNFCRVFLASMDGQRVAAKFIKVLSDVPAAVNIENKQHLINEYMDQYRRELLQYVEEIELTLQVAAHPNIITTYGFCVRPFVLLQELAKTSVKKYIEKLKDEQQISLRWLVGCCHMISKGMEHLHKHDLIHCDLALRNVLKMEDGTVKIGDFGLAKHIIQQPAQIQTEHNDQVNDNKQANNTTPANTDTSNYIYEEGEALPIRWMAPEVLKIRKNKQGRRKVRYSKAGDVWSFGVAIYELFSGERPYREILNNYRVRQEVCMEADPLRLSFRVGSCPDKLYEIQQQCFKEKEQRPQFEEIKGRLEEILREIEKDGDVQVKIEEKCEWFGGGSSEYVEEEEEEKEQKQVKEEKKDDEMNEDERRGVKRERKEEEESESSNNS